MADAHQVDIRSLRYSLASSEHSVFNVGVGSVGLVVALIFNTFVTGCTIWNVLFAACSTDIACLGWLARIWSPSRTIFDELPNGCTPVYILTAGLWHNLCVQEPPVCCIDFEIILTCSKGPGVHARGT